MEAFSKVMDDAQTARPSPLKTRTTRVRSSLTQISMTTAVHDALEALLHLRSEHGTITPADVDNGSSDDCGPVQRAAGSESGAAAPGTGTAL